MFPCLPVSKSSHSHVWAWVTQPMCQCHCKTTLKKKEHTVWTRNSRVYWINDNEGDLYYGFPQIQNLGESIRHSLPQGESDKFISAGLQKVLDVFLSVGERRTELTTWGVALEFFLEFSQFRTGLLPTDSCLNYQKEHRKCVPSSSLH